MASRTTRTTSPKGTSLDLSALEGTKPLDLDAISDKAAIAGLKEGLRRLKARQAKEAADKPKKD